MVRERFVVTLTVAELAEIVSCMRQVEVEFGISVWEPTGVRPQDYPSYTEYDEACNRAEALLERLDGLLRGVGVEVV